MCISVKQVRLECMIRFKIIDSYFRSSESSYLSYFFLKFQLILRLLFNCPHITDITWIYLWAFPCGFFICKVGKTVSLKVVKIELLNTVFCYSLKDCISTALTSLASLGLTLELFFAEFPWSIADGKMMFIFLFNRSLICRWTSD